MYNIKNSFTKINYWSWKNEVQAQPDPSLQKKMYASSSANLMIKNKSDPSPAISLMKIDSSPCIPLNHSTYYDFPCICKFSYSGVHSKNYLFFLKFVSDAWVTCDGDLVLNYFLWPGWIFFNFKSVFKQCSDVQT